MNYKAHLFVCTNKKDGKPCCSEKGAEEMRKNLKDWATKEFGKDVRVNAAGCLGQCEKGIAAVLYPQNQWFLNLKASDEETLKAALLKAAKG